MTDEAHYYGYCPTCFAPGVTRQRRPHGDDRCSNHHIYPSENALTQSEMAALLAERAALEGKTMTDAPEKIWAHQKGAWFGALTTNETTEYIRVDIHKALEEENERLRDALTAAMRERAVLEDKG